MPAFQPGSSSGAVTKIHVGEPIGGGGGGGGGTTVVAGDGLSFAGDTLNVGAGHGIDVDASDVLVDETELLGDIIPIAFVPTNYNLPFVPSGEPNDVGDHLGGINTALAETASRFSETAVQTSAYTASAWELVQADPTGGDFPISLPDPASTVEGDQVVVKNVDSSANAITIDIDGSPSGATIDGELSVLIEEGFGALLFVSDGINRWHVI